MSQELYFRQLLAGRDFARGDAAAAAMLNFVYAIGSAVTHECVLVDPAWDVNGLVDLVEKDGMKVVGALATHYHPDHVGGDLFGHRIAGAAELAARAGARVWVNRHEAEGVRLVTGLEPGDLMPVDSGDVLNLGGVEIRFLHTPGHTPGSHCFLVDGESLVSGDTLFVQGCGRVDLPGGDPEEMYRTLTQRLARLPDTTRLYPGHHYGPEPVSTLGDERRGNHYLRVPSLAAWRRLMG